MKMNKQVTKRLLSLLLAVVFLVSSIATQSVFNFAAAEANGTTGSNYVIACDTQQYVATTTGELPAFREVRTGKIRPGAGGSSALSYEYTVKNAYRTTGGKVLYPGEQIICIDHWTRYSFEKTGSMAVIQSYGLSYMLGNFAAKWEDYDKKIPREPRIDLLTPNQDFEAFSKPNSYKGSNGDTGTFKPEHDPSEDPDYEEHFDTELVFTTKTESGKEAELSYFGSSDGSKAPKEIRLQYAVFPYTQGQTPDVTYSNMITSATANQSAYASTKAAPPPSNWYVIVPYVENNGTFYGIAPSDIANLQILNRDLTFLDIRDEPNLGIKSIPFNSLKPWGTEWGRTAKTAAEGVSYFIMSATAELAGTDYFTYARNSRILTLKEYDNNLGTYNIFGTNIWQYDEDFLYAQVNDTDSSFTTQATESKAMKFFTKIVNTFEAAISNEDFKNLKNITLNAGEYSGWPFATGYKGSKTEGYADYYNPFYSLLSISTYNFYSHNILFSHVLGDGTKVPRYFSGSGIGAKTAVAEQSLQGSTKLQPFWSWQSFKSAHGANYAFCGDMEYPAGNMPNGRTAQSNADRMILLAEYINNKMTRSITSDAMTKISSLSSTVNNKDTFEAAITWNTSITKKFGDPQDLEKMYHFSFNDTYSYGSAYTNASFLVTDDNGTVTKTAADDYILVGPFYAHTDYPESRMQIGFTKNIDIGGLAKAGDEIITSKTPDGEVVADYVILTSEAVVNNRGQANTDRRKTDLYAGNANTTEYIHPMSDDATLMQSYEVVNGNVPLTNADLGKYDVNNPREVVTHQPTYWDGTTTNKDLYDPNLNKTKDPKYIINNWGKGEFFIAVRRTSNNVFANDLPQVTVGYQCQTGTLTQTNVDLTHTSHSGRYQGFLISDAETAKSSAVFDLSLKTANFTINKADNNGTPLNKKSFYLYRLADKDTSLSETDPNRYEWVRYVPIYANLGKNVHPTKDGYYPHLSDDLGNVSFEGLIPGWYMIYEKVDYSFRKVAYLQTHDPTEPQRKGEPITVDNSGYVDDKGQPYNTSVTLPVGARGQDVPIDDPLNRNPERAGDVFYVDNGVVKGLDMANTTTMKYNVYSGVVNDPVLFFKNIGDVNKLQKDDGSPLDITNAEYQQNIQFVLQAEEDKNTFFVAPVRDNKIQMDDVEIHTGAFPAEDEWIPFGTGKPVDDYWWIDSHKVRIEEHINPALGISKVQVKAITGEINTGRYEWDIMQYANNLNNGMETFENRIDTPNTDVILKIIKTDVDTNKLLKGAAFTLKCKGRNVYATSPNDVYAGTPNAYQTDAKGELTFVLKHEDIPNLEQLLKQPWELTEVAPPDGYKLPDEPTTTIFFKGPSKNAGNGTYIEYDGSAAIQYMKEISNKKPEDVPASLTVTKAWFQYVGGKKVAWNDGQTATFRLYEGEIGDRRRFIEEFTLSQGNPNYKKERGLKLTNYWIEEVGTQTGITVSYSSQNVTLSKANPNATISVENVKHEQYDYTIALAKKKSKQASMTGTSDVAFSNLPYYDGPAQFVITYNGPKGNWETTVTYNRADVGPDGYLKIKVPYSGDYRIREINIPEGYEPEIKVAGTGVDWSPIGADTPFGFFVPDNPGETVSLSLQIVNNKPASITVIKTDADTDKRIWDTNMELTMYADDGHGNRSNTRLGQAKKMNADGKFVFKTTDGYNFKVGDTVWLVETNPPKDENGIAYTPIEMSVYVSDKIGYENEVVEMKNTLPKSKFNVKKVGPKDEPVEGAIFEVYGDKNCTLLLASGTTDHNGSIQFTLRGTGPFYAKEVYVPDPYVLNDNVIPVTVTDVTIVQEIKVTNDKAFKIVVRKVDKDTGMPVANAEFVLLDAEKKPYKVNGQAVTGVSSAYGNIIWNVTGSQYLTVDTDEVFYLRETKTPGGYFDPADDFELRIADTTMTETGINAGCYEFTAENEAKYGVRIKKTEEIPNRPSTPAEADGIQGITFEIYDAKNTLISTQKTNDKGVIELKGLHYGEYYAIERADANSIYEISDKKIPLIVKPLNENDEFYEDSWSTYTWVENVRKKGSVSLYKVDDKGNFLSDITFAIYKYNGKGNPSAFKENECTLIEMNATSADGKLVFDNLELGKYWIVEVSKLPTYVPAEPLFVEITSDDAKCELGDVVGRFLTVQIVNKRVPASLRILKVDAETDKPVAGVKFTLSDGNTNVSGVTGADGILTFTNLTRGVRYTLTEIETADGYIINDKPIDITLSELDTEVQIKLLNSKHKGMIKIVKVDADDNTVVIPDAEFQLFADGEPSGNPKKTDENGIVTWENLTIGPNYTVREISVPAPYIVDTTEIPVTFTADKDAKVLTFEHTVTNKAEKFYVNLWKVDAETMTGLGGAEFDLYAADKTTKLNTAPIVVDSRGRITPIEVDAKGTYYFKEVKAPDGYVLDERWIEVTSYSGENAAQFVVIENSKKVQPKSYLIELIKVDGDTGVALSGAEFTLYDSNGNRLETKATGTAGTVRFEVSAEGVYFVQETKAPDGYELIDTKFRFEVNETQAIYRKEVQNFKDREYLIRVFKKDEVNNAPLGDAVFEVFDANYKKLGELTTTLPDGKGEFKVSNEGTYYLKEKTAPVGYKILPGYIEVTVGGTVNVVEKTIYNERTKDYYINIYKKDSVNNAPLADAVFNVYESDKTTLIGTVTTKLPNGSAAIKVPGPGTYYLREVQAPSGYKLVEGFIPVEVNETANVVEKTIYNEQDKYFITVYKKDTENKAPLGDAEFEVYDETNKFIGKFVTQLPTGASTFEVPNAGTYFLKEVKAPDGYVLKPDLIPVSVGGTTNVVERTIYNEKAEDRYIIRVYKKDKENKAPLSQAVIGVYDDQYHQVGTIVTTIPDGSGYLVVNKPGTYYLKELQAPRGYKLLDGYIPVTVNSNTDIVESSIYDEKEDETYNTIRVVKTDEDKEPLRGVKFGLYTDTDKLVDSGYTDKDGELLFSNLSDGSYYVKEMKQLPGYILDTTVYDLTVKGGDEKVIKVVNKKEEGEGWLSIKKYVTGTTTPLSNVQFRITSENGYDRTFATDTSGSIYISVPLGKYTIAETQGVMGYQMDAEAQIVTVADDGVPKDTVFYNTPENAVLAITKVDANTNAPLAGAKFGVYDSSEKMVATMTTDSNGRASATLSYGTYTLREIKAPDGYILDVKSSAKFTVDGSKPLVEMTISNNPIPEVVVTPKTGLGGDGPATMILSVCLAVVSGVALILLNRQQVHGFLRRIRR